jgi:protein O-mannosyl-transferase
MEASRTKHRAGSAHGVGHEGRSRAVGWAVLAFAVLAVQGRTFLHPFLAWDDPTAVTRNPLLHPPSFSSLGRIWSAPWSGLYVPASFTAYWIEMRVSQLLDAARAPDPRVFHAGLLLLHFLCACTVARILRRLVDDPRAALLGALLFAVHPLQTESVAWITETRGVLAACFGLLALDLHLAGMSREGGPSLVRHQVLPTVLFALALLSKPTAVAIPILAFLIDRFHFGLPLRRIVPPLAVWVAIVAGDVLLTRAQQGGPSIHLATPLWARPFVALDALAFYLGKLAWPFRLAADYGRRPDRLLEGSAFWWTSLVPIAVAGILAVLPSRRVSLLALALFAAALLPVLGLVAFDFQAISTVADRYAYLAMLGPAFLLSALAAHGGSRVRLAGASALVAALGAIAILDVPRWRDTATLFAANLEVNPRSHVALVQLGVVDEEADRKDEAAAKYRRALELEPGYPVASGNLGRILLERGDFTAAIGMLRDTVRENPDYPYACQDLAIALVRRGMKAKDEARRADFADAEVVLRETIRVQPGFPGAHLTLGQLLYTTGRYGEALAEFAATADLVPDSADARTGIDLCRQKLGSGAARSRP